jgi:hypothetical protein
VTGFADLDEAVARIHANKDELLVVLDRPDIPRKHVKPWEMLRRQQQLKICYHWRPWRDTI